MTTSRSLAALERLPLDQLSQRVQAGHHALLRDELVRLERLADQIAIHSDTARAGAVVASSQLRKFRRLLIRHLNQESDSVLDRLIRGGGDAVDSALDRPTIRAAVNAMRQEHQRLQEALAELQDAVSELAAHAPEPAVHELARDLDQAANTLHEQILAENRALFPRAAASGVAGALPKAETQLEPHLLEGDAPSSPQFG